MTYEVKVMVGCPASGKTSFIRKEEENLEEAHLATCVVSRDQIRKSLLQPGEDYFAREDEVFDEFVRQINEAMELCIDVVFVDATHINSKSRAKLLKRLKPDPNTTLTFEVMQTSAATCLTRNSKRKGFEKVPNTVIQNMMRNFEIPSKDEFPKDNYGFGSIRVNIHNER